MPGSNRRCRRPIAGAAAALGLLAALGGCGPVITSSVPDAAGIGAAAAAAAVSESAAAATAVGLGVRALASAGLSIAARRVHAGEQAAIATAAGPLKPGEVARWQIVHDVPLEPDQEGQVAVARDVGFSGFACREIIFSVETGNPQVVPIEQDFYVAMICRDGQNWHWASAEPSTGRWDWLQ